MRVLGARVLAQPAARTAAAKVSVAAALRREKRFMDMV
jgi:hypothetical protein